MRQSSKILDSDVIAAALEVDIEQITPAKVIELMEEHGLGNKTSRGGFIIEAKKNEISNETSHF